MGSNNQDIISRLTKAEQLTMLEESELGRWFREYLEAVKRACVKKLVKIPAEKKEFIMEMQILYKIADDFWNQSLRLIKDDGEVAFYEAKDLGILPGATTEK